MPPAQEGEDPEDEDARLAFLLTLHNLLSLHGLIDQGPSLSVSPKHRESPSALFQERQRSVRYRLGGQEGGREAGREGGMTLTLSAAFIEQRLLRREASSGGFRLFPASISRYFLPSSSSFPSSTFPVSSPSPSPSHPSSQPSLDEDVGDPARAPSPSPFPVSTSSSPNQLALRQAQPLHYFGLAYGTASSPPIRAYRHPSSLRPSLREQARAYLLRHVHVRREGGREGGRKMLVLPELLQQHWQVFGTDLASALWSVWALAEEGLKRGKEEGWSKGGRRRDADERRREWQAWEVLKAEVEEILAGEVEGEGMGGGDRRKQGEGKEKQGKKALWKRVEFVPHDYGQWQIWL